VSVLVRMGDGGLRALVKKEVNLFRKK